MKFGFQILQFVVRKLKSYLLYILYATFIILNYFSNRQQGNGLDKCEAVYCTLMNNGSTNCSFPCTHTVTCNGDHTNWPFDRQKCSLLFGTWESVGKRVKKIKIWA